MKLLSLVILTFHLYSCTKNSEAKKYLDSVNLDSEIIFRTLQFEDKFPVIKAHGKWDVIGEAVISKEDFLLMKKDLYMSLDKSDGLMAECFLPRHIILAESADGPVEFQVCFECDRLKIKTKNIDKYFPISRKGPSFKKIATKYNLKEEK